MTRGGPDRFLKMLHVRRDGSAGDLSHVPEAQTAKERSGVDEARTLEIEVTSGRLRRQTTCALQARPLNLRHVFPLADFICNPETGIFRSM